MWILLLSAALIYGRAGSTAGVKTDTFIVTGSDPPFHRIPVVSFCLISSWPQKMSREITF